MPAESEDFPLVVVFMIISALMMAAVLATVYSKQADARVEEEASSLLFRLSGTAFQSFSTNTIASVMLPKSIMGHGYIVRILENHALVLEITDGSLRGKTYVSVFTFPLVSTSRDFSPGQSVFFTRIGDRLLVCSTGEVPAEDGITGEHYGPPPEFYWFAKEHPAEATGALAVFFGTGDDVVGYGWHDESLVIETRENRFLKITLGHRISSDERWKITMIRPVKGIEEVLAIRIENKCPSAAEAAKSGWLISPQRALADLRSRTWVDANGTVSIPAEAQTTIVCVETSNGKSYPAWQIVFDNRIVLYRTILWWYADNDPGFLMQSLPEMYPLD